MPTTRGVVLYYSGAKFAERFAVMAYTLRQHWQGPVTVFCTLDASEEVARRYFAPDKRLDLEIVRRQEFNGKRHGHYVTKTVIPTWSPYDATVLIDLDTTVHGAIDELFEPPFAMTRFSTWHSRGRIMTNRIKQWKGISPAVDAMVEKQITQSFPAINTGIMGWYRRHPILRPWHELAVAGQRLYIPDELSMQLLFHELTEEDGAVLFDERFNCSCVYGVCPDPVIRHYHGDKHLKKDEGRAFWVPIFHEAYDQNIAGLADWAGKYDDNTKHVLPSRPIQVPVKAGCCGG